MSEEDAKEGLTRRTMVKGAIAVGALGLGAAGGAAILRTIAPPSQATPHETNETFVYVDPVAPKLPVWWGEEELVGKEARFSHFRRGVGANVLWAWYPDETGRIRGLPALLMRVDEEDLEFPVGYRKEDFVVEGLYAVFNHCTHAGCRTGWQLVPRSAYGHDLGYDTIFCPCHCAQFHPTRIGIFAHPGAPEGTGARYIGVANVAGPANRGMPLIPIEIEDDLIVGKVRDPAWYQYLDWANRPIP